MDSASPPLQEMNQQQEVSLYGTIELLPLYNAIPGNITEFIAGIVYECAAQVNNTGGNERYHY